MTKMQDLAYHYYRNNQFDDAINIFNQLIAEDPTNGNLYYKRGNCFERLKKYDEAIRDFEKALTLNPTDKLAWGSRANCFLSLRDYENAEVNFLKAIKQYPKFMSFHHGLGWTYLRLNRYREAYESFCKAEELGLELNLWSPKARCLLYGGQYDMFLKICNDEIERNPTGFEAYRLKGLGYQLMGWYEIQNNLKIMDSLTPEELINSGRRHLRLSLQSLSKAIELNNVDWKSFYYRGKSQSLLGELEGAIKDYLVVKNHRPNDEENNRSLDIAMQNLKKSKNE